MVQLTFFKRYLSKNTDAASLAVFRIFFGLLLFISIIRFWLKGWIEQLYIQPSFFFSYSGFEFVKPLGVYTYALFFVCALSALLVMLGYKYKIASILLFLSFTYIELMDKTYYLNHYYFVSLMCFILIFTPAHVYFSIDAYQHKSIRKQFIPKFSIDVVKLMLMIVYFYAGLAKLNSDWLFRASPLNIWLSSKTFLPLFGTLMSKTWFHYAMSWCGALYDLAIPFLLLNRKTRNYAFVAVVFFHVFTKILFPIGMFPYIMIIATIIFFDSSVHHKILSIISKLFSFRKQIFDTNQSLQQISFQRIIIVVFFVFFSFQFLFPFRYLFYPGELFWTEQGYRFSWRVMLVEKAGYAQFKVVDKKTGNQYHIDNSKYLTTTQEKQMSFQPDFILQYAHYLGDIYKEKGIEKPQVFVDSYVTLNGRLSSRFVKKNVDLYQYNDCFFKHKNWVESFNHPIKIKGL